MSDFQTWIKEYERALKTTGTILPDDLGAAMLAPMQYDRFVRAAEHRTRILPEARFETMTSDVFNIDRIWLPGKVLYAAEVSGNGHPWHSKGDQAHQTLAASDARKPTIALNTLVARELVSVISISDKTLRRNIERGNFEDTLLDLLGNGAGRDIEEMGLYADHGGIAHGNYDTCSITDGWIKLAENKLYAWDDAVDGSTEAFDMKAANWPENMFDAILNAIPSEYLDDPTEFRFYVPRSVKRDYLSLLKARGTPLGDRAMVEGGDIPYEGIPVVFCPMLERSGGPGAEFNSTNNYPGKCVLFSHPDNLVWGVFHNITVEPEREAKDRRTDFVLSLECDVGYEDQNGAVAVFLERPSP